MEKRSIPINSVSYTAALQRRIPYVTQSHRAKALIQLPDATKLSIDSCKTTVSIRTYLDHFPDYCNMIKKECPWMSYSTIAYYSNINWSDKQPLCHRCWRRPSELFLQVRALQLSWLAGFSCAWAMISVYDFRVFMISCQISSTECRLRGPWMVMLRFLRFLSAVETPWIFGELEWWWQATCHVLKTWPYASISSEIHILL